MIKSMVNPESSAITRFFAQLDNVLMSHYAFVNTRVFANGDSFRGEFTAPTATVASNERITDGDNTVNPALFELASDGTYNIGANMTVTVGGVAITGASSYPTDGKLQEYEFTFTGAARIKYLAKNEASATNFFNGIQASPSTTISGVTENWTLGLSTGNSETGSNGEIIDYVNIPDSNRELFTLIEGDWVGVERWTAGTYTATGLEGTFSFVLSDTGILSIGDNYRFTGEVTGITSGQYRVRFGSASDTHTFTTNELFTVDMPAVNEDVRWRIGSVTPNAGAKIALTSAKRLIEIA
jgi:hypothetical protein